MSKKAVKRAKKAQVVHPQFQILDLNTGEPLVNEIFADKDSALEFASRFLPFNQDFSIEDRMGGLTSPPPPPQKLAEVYCFESYKFGGIVKRLH